MEYMTPLIYQKIIKTLSYIYSKSAVDEKMQNLNVLATHGYEIKGIGASVKLGVGVIGIVAKNKKMMKKIDKDKDW